MMRYGWLTLLFIATLILPHVIGEYWIHVSVEILILGLFAVSFNMIFGYMGQLSFGHAAYFGVGAYATGLLMVKTSVPLPIGLAASMITAGLLALVIGYFASIDSTLHRVRTSHDSHSDTLPLNSKALPVSQKLSIFLSITVLLIVATMAISAYGYINIDTFRHSATLSDIKQEFIVEMLFILGIIITLTTRVIVSYSANLEMMFETQIEMLKTVPYDSLADGQTTKGDYGIDWSISAGAVNNTKNITVTVTWTGDGRSKNIVFNAIRTS